MSVDIVNDITPRVQYVAATSQVDFDYPFPIFADSDLVVDVDGVTKALSTQYTVSGEGDDTGGTVTFVVAPGSGAVVTIYRDIPIERTSDLQQNGPLASATFNDELDTRVMVEQQLAAKLGRTLRLSEADDTDGADLILPDSRAEKFLYFNAQGIPEYVSGTPVDPRAMLRQDEVASGGQTVFNTDYTYTVGADNLLVMVNGVLQIPGVDYVETSGTVVTFVQGLSVNDRVTFLFGVILDSVESQPYYPPSDAEVTAGVTIVESQYVWGDVRRYGAIGNGVTDDTNALLAAGMSSKAPFIDPSLVCLVTGSLAAGMQSGQRWSGGGKVTTANGFNFNVFNCSGKTDVTVDGIVGESGTLGVAYSSATARFFRAVSGSHRCKMLNCRTTGFQSAAQVNASADCVIAFNEIDAPYGWGVNVQTDADYCQVVNNRILDAVNEHGIYVAGSAGNLIASPIVNNNVITGCAIDGVKLSRCSNANVSDNVSTGNGQQGIYVTVGTERADVNHNQCHDNGHNGILVFDSTENSDRNRVHHNAARNNGRDGIFVSSSGAGTVSRTTVSANDVEANDSGASGTYYGIEVAGATTTTKTRVLENVVTDEVVGVKITSGIDAEVGQNYYENNSTALVDTATTTRIDHITRGATSVADGGTVTHGHVKTPTSVRCTASVTGEFVSVTAISSTTFTVAVKKHDNSAGTTQTVYWEVAG